MKKVISAVLTAAMVVGMGVSVLAATPSKTVADEVKASGSATVTGVLGIVSDVWMAASSSLAVDRWYLLRSRSGFYSSLRFCKE